MSGFMRTLIFGMAMLGMLLVGVIITALMLLSGDQQWRAAQRTLVLSVEEREILEREKQRTGEPPLLRYNQSQSDIEIISEIANKVNRDKVNSLVENLRSRQNNLDDRSGYLERMEQELKLARADLLRMQVQISMREENLRKESASEKRDRLKWIKIVSAENDRVNVINKMEMDNIKRSVAMYEKMKGDAWSTLRQLEVDEISKILYHMSSKSAAGILVQATQDDDYPLRALELQREMMKIDTTEATGNQVQRLADFYAFIAPQDVLPLLSGKNSKQIAAIMTAMKGNGKTSGRLLAYMQQESFPNVTAIQRYMLEADSEGGL